MKLVEPSRTSSVNMKSENPPSITGKPNMVEWKSVKFGE